MENDDDQVEDLATDEATEIYIVFVVDVLQKERNEPISLFLLVLDKPSCRSFSEELHQSALHHDPEHTREVEHDGEEDEVERNPLVVRVVHLSPPSVSIMCLQSTLTFVFKTFE